MTGVALLTVALVAASSIPRLPIRSGPFKVGRVAYDWSDPARSEVLSPSHNTNREIMVYIWYPTESKRGKPGPYFPGAKLIDQAPGTQAIRDDFGSLWPLIVSGAIQSGVQDSAPVAPGPKPFPVILFSHGLGGSSFEYTVLFEDLVSQGYVVAAVEHTYEANAVAFPDGRVFPFSEEISHQMRPPPGVSFDDWIPKGLAAGQERTDVKAADLRFVLDRLFQLNCAGGASSRLAGRLDLTRVAAMGHSAGGSVAVRACQLDSRIKACISLDGGGYPVGAFLNEHNAPSPRQPFLFVEAYRPPMRMDPAKWNAFLSRMDQQLRDCSGGSYHVTLKPRGIVHGSFSDEPLLMAGSDARAQRTALHNLYLVETVTRAFLDKYLKDKKETLFDGPTDASREIGIARNSR